MTLPRPPQSDISLFLCGDVMTGRGIDQILPHAGEPQLFEPFMRSALGYVKLAEDRYGPLPRPVDFSYIWGDALPALARAAPDVRIVNLETAVTASGEAWPEKGIHYRMHPANLPCLAAARIDCCVLANNHVLDWGYRGLAETLMSLRHAGIATAGAGMTLAEAAAPAILDVPGKGRVVVFAWALEDSGVPSEWGATEHRPGVNLLPDISPRSADAVANLVRKARQENDVVVASIHWGGNWGFEISERQRRFAQRLIESGAVDVVHGHSSHHAKGIEIHHDKPIIYGCGDFLNDYEGISGHEAYRGDLALMYFPTFHQGRLKRFEMTAMRIRYFQTGFAQGSEIQWLADTLNREGRKLGTRVIMESTHNLLLQWET
ncbi:MAG TPA: CapA family protein [Burkholderiaceae bacterium]